MAKQNKKDIGINTDNTGTVSYSDFDKLYSNASQDEKDVLSYIVSKMQYKSNKQKTIMIDNVKKMVDSFIEFYIKNVCIKGYREFKNGKEENNTSEEENRYKNTLANIYRMSKTIKNDLNDKGKSHNIIEDIKKKYPNDEDVKLLEIPKREIFDNIDEALKCIKNKKTCVIKPAKGADSHNIFIKNKDGTFWDVYQGKQFDKGIEGIIELYKEKKKKKVVLEENVTNDINDRQQRNPYRFYCANGNVFSCRLCFDYDTKTEPFKKRNGFYDIYLNEDMLELEYVKQELRMSDEEKKWIKLNLCDKDTYKKMWRIAEKLSKDYPSMRVDLFCVKQKDEKYKIYFNELQPNDKSTIGYFKDELTNEGIKKYNDMQNFIKVDDKKLYQAGKVIKSIQQSAYINQRRQYRKIQNVNNFSIKEKKKQDNKIVENVNTLNILGKKKEANKIVKKVNNVTINKEQKEYKDKQKLIKENDKENKIINLNKNNEMKKNNKANNDKNKITSKRNHIFLPLIYNNMNNMKKYSDNLRNNNKRKELYYNNFKYNKDTGVPEYY